MNREARDRAAEMRARRDVVRRILEMLPASFSLGATHLTRGPSNTHVLRTDRGQLLASFTDRHLAQFLHDAPEHLRAMSDYIEILETTGYSQRERIRDLRAQLGTVRDELDAADSLGLASKDGQRRVRAALRAVRHDHVRDRDA